MALQVTFGLDTNDKSDYMCSTVLQISSGTVRGWGGNMVYQLGDGTTEDRHSPVRIMEIVTSPEPGPVSDVKLVSSKPTYAYSWRQMDGIPPLILKVG